jgi:NADPH2:quinone reductase
LSDLVVEEVDEPSLRAGAVKISVEAAGVNYVDALFVEGRYQIKPTPPFTPGSEIAGTVIAVGEGVEVPRIGDRVLASPGLGGFAEFIVVAAEACSVLPQSLSFAAAACFTQSYSTALYTYRHRVHLRAGERVLVLGGGGGVGLAAIRVGAALGAEVYAAASTPQKRAAALAAGATAVIDGDPDQLKMAVRAVVGGGVDVVVDPVGGPSTEASLRNLRDGGRLAVIGFAAGSIPEVPSNLVLLRNRSLVGVDWGIWAMSNGRDQGELLRELLSMVGQGELTVDEPTTFPLEHGADALRDLIGRRVVGKIALTP